LAAGTPTRSTATSGDHPAARGVDLLVSRLAWEESRSPLAVPLVLIVTIPIADHFLPADVHLAHLLVVALAFTAAIAGPRPRR
jgi:hypothetical protein